MAKNFEILINKIDRFIRRYYLNQLIKGSLFFGTGLIVLFLLFITVEYFGYLTTNARFALFYAYVIFNLVILIRYILIPLFGILKIGKRITPEQAAKIIGVHYKNELNDKITNVLQLKRYLDENPLSAELIIAGIDQKMKIINPLPFKNVLPLKSNLRLLPYFLIPLFVVALFYLLQPSFIIEPATRIVNYEMYYERPRPFSINIISSDYGFKHENLEVIIEAKGTVLPSEANIIINRGTYRMINQSKGVFSYTIRNVQNDIEFFVNAQGFLFGPYSIQVFEKPAFNHFHIEVTYPEYTGLTDDSFSNMGDLSVIYGSKIEFDFYTNANSQIKFYKEKDTLESNTIRDGMHKVKTNAYESFSYRVFAFNEELGKGDSLSYYVNVQKDGYPRIAVEEHRDDVLLAHLFYRGTIEDDFGFTKLYFNYRAMTQAQINRNEDIEFMREEVEIDKHLKNQSFYHHFDLRTIYAQPGETIEIFFEVFDNDVLSGPKSSKSRMFTYYIPTQEEILADRRQTEEKIEDGISDGIGEVQQARDQIEELRKQLLDSDRMGWEQREMLQELLDKKDQVEESLKELQEEKRKTDTRSEQFMETDERIKQKQEELQKLFDEVLTDELKELFDKIRDELDNLSRDDVYEMLDQMEFELRDLELQMDRTLEMFRQFAMERLLDESINKLDELAEQQEELLKDNLEETKSTEELSTEQEEINKGFDKVQEMMEDFRQLNEKLQRPKQIEDTGEQEQSIADDIQNALEQLKDDNKQMATPHQQDAGQKMKDMSESLKNMQEGLFAQHLAEDARAIRMILENLLRSSFAQEDLMVETRQANVNDPRFVEMLREQRKIQSDLQMIEDSLIALSKRQIAIQSFVNREVSEIHLQLRQGIEHMINRRRHQTASRQQLIMTHINNLALLLNESLQDIQQQMSMGNGMGDDPQEGAGGMSFQDLREMQEALNELLKQLQEGQQPSPGETGEGGMSMSEQMARMAAEQEAIRNKLKELADEMRNQGMDVGNELDQLQRDMERSELDMLRKQITRQTLFRQEEILTRLLEHERAELIREQEERREGTTAFDWELSNPEDFFEYNRIREREVEMLRSMPPGLRPFYRSLVEKYFLNVD